MKGLRTMLKALGIEISDEHIAAIQELLPKLPQLVQQGIAVINEAVNRNYAEHQTLKIQNARIIELLEDEQNARRNRDRIGPGDTGTSR